MFNRIPKKRKQLQIEDDVFGRLMFVETNNPSDSFWEGRGRFNPINAEVSYNIRAGEAGPGESHRDFYRSIERRYGELLLLVTPLLQRECAAQLAACDVYRRQLSFSLDIVDMPEPESESMEWRLVFSCAQWEDALFTVHMKGWQPNGRISVMD